MKPTQPVYEAPTSEVVVVKNEVVICASRSEIPRNSRYTLEDDPFLFE